MDNSDYNDGTMSGIGSSHDSTSILVQDKPGVTRRKPKISETNVAHGARQFKHRLPCQELQDYFKPGKKPDLPEDYNVSEDLFEMNEYSHCLIEARNVAWVLSRLNYDNIAECSITELCDNQSVPAWSGFNALLTDEDLPIRNIGFMPVLPHPITDEETVYTALKNFQGILKQLKQSKIPVTCDEGVYRIAREIMLNKPEEFENIVLYLGSFHLIKVYCACIGKYLDGGGAETIFVDKSIFGANVVNSVLSGAHYEWSIHGLLLMSEAIERIQWWNLLDKMVASRNTRLSCRS